MGIETEPGQPPRSGLMFWSRVREHKVIQWSIGYAGAALALAQGLEFVADALAWPETVSRVFVIALVVGFPIVLTLAWYHGHKGLTQISAGELSIVSVLVLIGALLVTAVLRPDAGSDRESAISSGEAQAGARVPESGGGTPEDTDRPVSDGFLPNSIAVLPLENLSPNPDNAHIAAGLHEEILNQLVKVRRLTVIGRTSVLQYATDRPTIPEIGRALRAQSVMEGSVRYAGNRVRVTMQLVESVTGAHLWSETYEREFDDVFAIESDIAMNVANALATEFSPEEQRRIQLAPKVSGETYAAFLRVLTQMSGGSNQAPEMLRLLDRLIEDAPEFAPLHGWKAWTYTNTLINTTFGGARETAEVEALARTSAERALALDPYQHQANSALANIEMMTWNWAAAGQTFERYYRTTGRTAGSAEWFAVWSNRNAEAIEIARREAEREPFAPGSHWYLGTVLTSAHEYDAAAAAFERAIELAVQPPLFHTWLAFVEVGRGNPEAALRELTLAESLLGDDRAIIYLVDILYCYGRLGRTEDARRVFAEIETISKTQEIGAGGWAMAYLAVGDQERALEQLRIGADRAADKVLDQGFFSLMNLRVNVTSDPVLEQPAFAAVRAKLTGE